MPIGDPFTAAQNIPAVNDAGVQYATDVNEVLTELVSRTSAKVPFSALSGTSLDLANVPALNFQYLQLYEQTTAPTTAVTGRLVKYLNNLYWVHPSGVLQLTSGTAINLSTLGGFAGDYTATGSTASARYVAAASRFDFYSNFSTGEYALVRAREFNIANSTTGTFFAQLRYAGAATNTFTFPANLPVTAGRNSVMVISDTGQMEHNDAADTIENDIFLDPVINNVIRHGDRTLLIPMIPTFGSTAGVTMPRMSATGAGTTSLVLPGIHLGWRLKGFTVRIFKSGVGTSSILFFKYNMATSTTTQVGTTVISNTSGNTTITHTFSTPEAVALGRYYYIDWIAAGVSELVDSIELVYDTQP